MSEQKIDSAQMFLTRQLLIDWLVVGVAQQGFRMDCRRGTPQEDHRTLRKDG